MQQLKEFLTRIQTFNLRITRQQVGIKHGTNDTEEMDAYDITRETQYYDSFSYKSELRVLKDMAFLDILALDKQRMPPQLAQLYKVKDRFKELWASYHSEHSEYYQVYNKSYIFSIKLDTLFIVRNLQADNSDIGISGQFVEDLGDSIKLREKFLMELIRDIETILKASNAECHGTDDIFQPEMSEATPSEQVKPIARYPTFFEDTAAQLFSILKPYFVTEDHTRLSGLLLKKLPPGLPLVFRGNANQLADAFKQLFDANIIVGCMQTDLERWIALYFLYLSPQGHQREFTEDYLNGMISTKTRPCKSPILKIEQKEDKFIILPTPRNKK
jgi:hypothetical protein